MKITPQFSGVNRPLSVELALIFIAPGVGRVGLQTQVCCVPDEIMRTRLNSSAGKRAGTLDRKAQPRQQPEE
jgi:hypothetical protein